HARGGSARAQGGRARVTATLQRGSLAPALLGLGSLLTVIVLVEMLIRVGVINRYIVPLPSQIVMSFGRLITAEDIFAPFRLTFFEALSAGALIAVVGVSIGILLYRVNLLRLACETWIAALASAPNGLI